MLHFVVSFTKIIYYFSSVPFPFYSVLIAWIFQRYRASLLMNFIKPIQKSENRDYQEEKRNITYQSLQRIKNMRASVSLQLNRQNFNVSNRRLQLMEVCQNKIFFHSNFFFNFFFLSHQTPIIYCLLEFQSWSVQFFKPLSSSLKKYYSIISCLSY